MSGRRIYLDLCHKLSRILNPALCLSCGIPVPSSHFICPSCLVALERVDNPCCCCGLPNRAAGTTCPACRFNPPRWDSMTAPLVYSDNTRKLIHDLKFNEQIHYANAIITHIIQHYQNRCVETLIPVPLHYTRLLERGFNQSEEIARILSHRLNIPVDTRSLMRVKVTEPQSGLSISKRRQNILKAFRFKPKNSYRSVAIVDDIITTGSTLAEISKVLRRAGITHIEVWSVARALKHD